MWPSRNCHTRAVSPSLAGHDDDKPRVIFASHTRRRRRGPNLDVLLLLLFVFAAVVLAIGGLWMLDGA
jgi:hypothetical protein